MAETHASRIAKLEQVYGLVRLLTVAVERERAETARTIERLTARIERLEREAATPPVMVWPKSQRASLS
jgi:hypothetical protein